MTLNKSDHPSNTGQLQFNSDTYLDICIIFIEYLNLFAFGG